eukprot:gene7768-8614_t
MGKPPPGTAKNPGTARPGSRGGIGQQGALGSAVQVADRPVTRQGLAGIKTASQGPQRQVQDKSYWLGLIRSKISELSSEISKLNRDINNFNQENASYVSYEKRAESLAGEIKDLQGQLADCNMLVDKLNTNSSFDDLKEDYEILKSQNEKETKAIDELFSQRQGKEQNITGLETEIDQQKRMTESMVADMPSTLREKYAQLKKINLTLQRDLEAKEAELDELSIKIERFEDEVSHSTIKQEAVSLHEKISELEEKKKSLVDEMERNKKSSPAEERERLLKQVKEDNQEIARIENRISEIKEKIENVQEEVRNLDMDLEEHQGERTAKYKELKKRDETMQDFLDSFESNKRTELDECKQLQSNIVTLLERISRAMIQTKHMPNVDEYKQIKDDLSFKENEMVKSSETNKGLDGEHRKLQMDLDKVNQLESKITTELDTLKEKIREMEEAIGTYSDIDALKKQADEKKRSHDWPINFANFVPVTRDRALIGQIYGLRVRREITECSGNDVYQLQLAYYYKDMNFIRVFTLMSEKQELLSQRETLKKDVQNLSSQYDGMKVDLQDNETYTQLGNLERKWQHLEQNNFAMKECLVYLLLLICISNNFFTTPKAAVLQGSETYVGVVGSNTTLTWTFASKNPPELVEFGVSSDANQLLKSWKLVWSKDHYNIQKLPVEVESSEYIFVNNTNVRYDGNRTFYYTISRIPQNITKYYFMCRVRETEWDAPVHKIATVKIAELWNVNLTSTRSQVSKGGKIHMSCTSKGFPIPRVNLYREVDSKLVSIGNSLQNLTYSISNIQPKDAGKYICTASNMAGTLKSAVTVTVTYIDLLDVSSKSRWAKLKEKVSLHCSIIGTPQPSYSWYKGNKKLNENGDKLNLQPELDDDFGMYTCKALNSAGEKSMTFDLKHLFILMVTIKVHATSLSRLGDTKSLLCPITGNPAVDYSWHKNNKVLSNKESLTVTLDKKEKFGNYSCTAKNDAGMHTATFELQELKQQDIRTTTRTLVRDDKRSYSGRCKAELSFAIALLGFLFICIDNNLF